MKSQKISEFQLPCGLNITSVKCVKEHIGIARGFEGKFLENKVKSEISGKTPYNHRSLCQTHYMPS